MKVSNSIRAPAIPQRAKATFSKVLPKAAMKSPVQPRQVAAAQTLVAVRAELHAYARHLRIEREEGHLAQWQRVSDRAVELITKELTIDLEAEATRTSTGTGKAPITEVSVSRSLHPLHGQGTDGGSKHTEQPAHRAAAVAALIDKIEVFVRSGRPAMQLSLHRQLGLRVELERVGPREVSVRLKSASGGLTQLEERQLELALRQKGLRLAQLSIETSTRREG